MGNSSNATALVGRVLLGLIFVVAGAGKLTAFAGLVSTIAGKGLPMPQVLAVLTVLVEVGGGLMLVLGFKARLAAIVLFLFVIPVSLTFHNFWTMEGAARMANQTQFLKNLSIMGGLLLLAAFGPGRYGMDRR